MKEILLTKGRVALVDDEDYEWLSQWKWYAHKVRNTYYADRHKRFNGKRKTISMHRLLIDIPEGFVVDHVDGNGLNNQKNNLRAVTVRQNQQNGHTKRTSKYPGVCQKSRNGKWSAEATVSGKIVWLGHYCSEIEAFRAYYDFILSIGEEILDFAYPEA